MDATLIQQGKLQIWIKVNFSTIDTVEPVNKCFTYIKAYGRMGLANSSLEKHKEAVDNFKKALELEPDNESYKSNLQIAEDKVRIQTYLIDKGIQNLDGSSN